MNWEKESLGEVGKGVQREGKDGTAEEKEEADAISLWFCACC
jgi:hypothetical protein